MIPSLDTVRKRVATLREKHGVTQAALAEKADVSQSLVAKLENGTATPNYDAVARIYNTLDAMEQGDDTVADVMAGNVVAVASTDTVRETTRCMKRDEYSQLPVIDDGSSVGSITSKALLHAEPDEPIKQHMDAPFPVVPADTSLDAAAELLQAADAVLVQDGDEIVGIVTPADVI